MELGLTILLWIAVTYLILILLAYAVAIVGSIVLAIKGKNDHKQFREKRNREWIEKEKEFENRMKERREEFYKRNRHISKDLDKHFKE
ncbi:hypothetical protein BUZ33_03410 [Staphylococcus haemolyticus]|uniref:hypothetical protein n=1 Tax=Staphylococcus haemolyticus TaxID=1283 RepID=UPI000D4B00E7|nr:hypothetical protein [Staphylococcus haemolyticus]MCE4993239.1 hypothetical protein [Staphylococcus haemolyticus]PTK56896.1 hypothetical protein BUZ33_03410 [Staphylococcus haemolyticus]